MSSETGDAEGSSSRGSFFELFLVVALAVGLALGVQAAIAKPYQIPSESMLPTLEVGQRVVADRVSYHFGDPDIGDVVVFKPPIGAVDDHGARECARPRPRRAACSKGAAEQASQTFIKRIVAGPGDRLSIARGHAVVNGVRAQEDFVVPCRRPPQCNLTNEITVPEDHYFMLGDNRPHSRDSRYWGPVHRDWIIGRALITYWPPDRVGGF